MSDSYSLKRLFDWRDWQINRWRAFVILLPIDIDSINLIQSVVNLRCRHIIVGKRADLTHFFLSTIDSIDKSVALASQFQHLTILCNLYKLDSWLCMQGNRDRLCSIDIQPADEFVMIQWQVLCHASIDG